MELITSPLTSKFGVEVHDLNLSEFCAAKQFPQLRALFEAHSAMLFRGQDLAPDDHLRLAEMFGPIEDRMPENRNPGEKAGVSPVTNEREGGGVTDEMDILTQHLKANQLWHIDSTFLPTPALCNILTARVVTDSGGETELASSRAAWAAMPNTLRRRIRGRVLKHNYTRSRAMISRELAKQSMFNKWPPQRWPAIWVNPVNGKEALYIASHVFEIEGLGQSEGEELLEELIQFCTHPRFTYSHKWDVGDVLIWDQRAVLHRGLPWPYGQPRTLVSVCASLTEDDGLGVARAATGEARESRSEANSG